MRHYSMDETGEVAKEATEAIEEWLRQRPEVVGVENVEDDDEFRQIDVDLIVSVEKEDELTEYQIEVKEDRWDTTGNFVLETISNKEKGTPGCFMYTEADYVFYYFVNSADLYILPMPESREWFKDNLNQFEEKSTQTAVRTGGAYTHACQGGGV